MHRALVRSLLALCLLLPACGSGGDTPGAPRATRTPDPNATATRTRPAAPTRTAVPTRTPGGPTDTPRPTRTPGPPVTLFVRPNGNDMSAGTRPDAPLRTLAAAANRLSPGSTIYVGAGTYRERLTVTGVAGTSQMPVRIIADRSGAQTGGPSGEVVIDANGGLVAVIVTNSQWLTLDGFIIRGAAPTAESAAVDLRIRSASNNVTVQHCTVANAEPADGIRVDSSNDVLLFNNLVFATERGVVITGSAARTRLVNNTIALTDRAGLSLRAAGGASPRNTEVINTIFQETGPQIAIEANAAIGFRGNFNLVFQPELEDQAAAYQPPAARGAADLNVDARFVNLDVGDVHLQPNSPAIDAGSGRIERALEEELLRRSTGADGARDRAPVDMGYHYPR